jgi:hypothetical protein
MLPKHLLLIRRLLILRFDRSVVRYQDRGTLRLDPAL